MMIAAALARFCLSVLSGTHPSKRLQGFIGALKLVPWVQGCAVLFSPRSIVKVLSGLVTLNTGIVS